MRTSEPESAVGLEPQSSRQGSQLVRGTSAVWVFLTLQKVLPNL